jgi:hypothetical protein
MRIFQAKLTTDPAKKSKAQTTTSFNELHNTVKAAQAKYDEPSNQTKTRERLRAFSGTLLFYGNIMEVLMQHHPEYVSLAWGAMKFLFVVRLILFSYQCHQVNQMIDHDHKIGVYEL